MKNGLSKNSLGLTLGIYMGAAQLAWAILLGLGWAKPVADWLMSMHMFTCTWDVLPFNWLTSLELVVMTFVGGYVFGWIMAGLWNLVSKD